MKQVLFETFVYGALHGYILTTSVITIKQFLPIGLAVPLGIGLGVVALYYLKKIHLKHVEEERKIWEEDQKISDYF